MIIGSAAGVEAYPGGSGYNAAKFAAHAIKENLRLELLGEDVRVTEILPGAAETEFGLVRFGATRRGPRRRTRASRHSPRTTSPSA